jgi:lysophospholipase L1-like esterase
VVAAALVAVAGLLALLAGCSGLRSESRALPEDREAPVAYVALGDSTVEGVGASRGDAGYVAHLYRRLRAVYPAARVVNLGVGGATSGDVLRDQLDPAVELAPDLVTLSVGPNDLTGRVPVTAFEANMDRILTALRTRSRAVVVVSLLPDLAVTPRFRGSPEREAVGRLTVEFNEAVRRAAVEHGATVVDLYEPSRREVPQRPELVARDGYHPSDLGHARWAELMWRGLQGRIAACREGSDTWTRC